MAAHQTDAGARLIVVLHGDLASAADAYQYRFAASVHEAVADAVVVALLRPGYSDNHGARSPGAHGLATGDNYTPQVIAALDAAVSEARARYHAASVTLVGHSGGAVLAVDLAAFDPAVASRLLLVSCPCDLQPWRLHMAGRQLNPLWLLPTRSVSPIAAVVRLPKQVRVRLVVGREDPVAPPALTTRFAAAARSAGLRVQAVVLPDAAHAVLLDRRVLDQLIALEAER